MQPTASSTPLARRSIGSAPAEWERSHTTSRVGGSGQRGHVGDLARPVADVREDHERRAALAHRLLRRVDHPQLAAAAGREALEHVAVGREVAAVGDDRPGARVEHGAAQLVEVDGGRVADDHLAGAGAEDVLGEQVADARGDVDPVVPAGDELRAPLLDGGGEPVAGRDREAAERVAVEIEAGRIRVDEAVAELAERDPPRRARPRRPRKPLQPPQPVDHRLPQRVLRIEVAEVVLVRLDHQVAARSRGRTPRSSPAGRCRPCRRASTARARRAGAARRARRRRSARAAARASRPAGAARRRWRAATPTRARGRARRPARRRR